MKQVRVLNVTRNHALGTMVAVADGWWSRLCGLLGKAPLRPGEGLLLKPCRAVHMFGMKQSLDVILTNGTGKVVAVYPGLAPGQRTGWHADAQVVFELPPSTIASTGTEVADRLSWELTEAGSHGSVTTERPSVEAAVS